MPDSEVLEEKTIMIIGRKQELAILKRLYDSPTAEFLAVYGRRRIGKTYLITQFFKNLGVYFEITGRKESSKKDQLANFHREFMALFRAENDVSPPKDWDDAFHRLKEAISTIPAHQKVILFFDELPWLSSKKSGFLSALDYFWNRHASRMPNVLVVICGSAASWMIKKVINDRGGLYGRLSAEICLQPFTLREVEEYFKEKKIELSRKQIIEVFMATGGVPKYLTYIERGQSANQIIQSLCFSPKALFSQNFTNCMIHCLKMPTNIFKSSRPWPANGMD